MASLASVFNEPEKINWLKAWLALDITKKGLNEFVDQEIRNVQTRIIQTACGRLQIPTTTLCTDCSIANLCPTHGLCRKSKHTFFTVHDSPAKQPRACPKNLCDAVRDEITREHKFEKPSWKNTSAEQWGANSWQIAKCFMPPDGYAGVTSVQDTDFNGIINVMLNCKHFVSTVAFTIAPQSNSACLLTKARFFCKAVRHTTDCKVNDAVLKDMFTCLKTLLNDPFALAKDQYAQEAVLKFIQLENDTFNMTQVYQLMQNVQESLHNAAGSNIHISKAMDEFNDYLEKHKDEFNKHVEQHKQDIVATTNQCIESIQRAKINDDEANYAVAIKDFQGRLIQHYHIVLSHLSISPLIKSADKPLKEIFVKPKIYQIETHNNGNQTYSKKILSYKDILFNDKKFNRHIFLQGETGMGKTTLAAKIVQDWCSSINGSCDQDALFKDVETLMGIQFVIHIVLRESTEHHAALEMIKDQIIDMIYYGEERAKAFHLLQQIMSKETCLVIQDGLDEWADPHGKLALPLMVSSHHQCTVLITTRPWRMADERIKDSYIDHLLELKGVDDPFEQSKLILCCFNTDDTYRKEFEDYIHENSLKELLNNPMLMSLIVCAWVEGVRLTGSKCKIYALLLDCLFKKATDLPKYYDCLPVPCFINTKYLQPNEQILDNLSKLAFERLFSSEKQSSLVFKESIFTKYIDVKHKAVLLRSGVVTEKKSSTLTYKQSTFSFIHKSVQEFFAAYYCAKNEHVIDAVVLDYLVKRYSEINEVCLVFEFLCGLNINAAYKLSRKLNEHVMLIMYNDTHIQEIEDNPNTYILQDMMVSGFCEARENGWKEIPLELRFFSDITWPVQNEVLDGILKANISFIHTLMIYNSPAVELQKIVNLCAASIEILSASSYNHHDTSTHNNTCLDLSLCQRLKTLSIYVETMVSNISCQFNELVLFACSSLQWIQVEGLVALHPNCLHRLHKLTCISLDCNNDGLDLSCCPNLETINIRTPVILLKNGLRGLQKLKYATLSCECDGLDLSCCPNLETIYIHKPVKLLQNGLRGLQKLKYAFLSCECDGLDLSFCPNIETINIQTPVILLPNGLRGLQRLKYASLSCECDGLDLSSCPNIKTINIHKTVTLLPNALHGLQKLKEVSLKCKCDGLDLSSCPNIEKINIHKTLTLLPNALHGLQKLKEVSLKCKCDGLDLSSCPNIETISILGPVTLLPNALHGLQKLKELVLYCSCNGLDLSLCPNTENIYIYGNVKLMPNALHGLQNLRRVYLTSKCDELDLSSSPNIEHINIFIWGSAELLLDLSLCPNIENIRICGDVKLMPNAQHGLKNLRRVHLNCKCDELDLSSCPNIEHINIFIWGSAVLLPKHLHGLEKLSVQGRLTWVRGKI